MPAAIAGLILSVSWMRDVVVQDVQRQGVTVGLLLPAHNGQMRRYRVPITRCQFRRARRGEGSNTPLRRHRTMNTSAKLMFLCGKMAAGKSTLARDLAERHNAILLVQDEFLDKLFPGEITDIPGFIDRSSRLRDALTPHICAVLSKGISVVLDFPGNTKAQRAWFRELFEGSRVEHELHFVDASDDLCKRQLKHRSRNLSPDTAWTTDADFDAVTAYFQPP